MQKFATPGRISVALGRAGGSRVDVDLVPRLAHRLQPLCKLQHIAVVALP